MRWVFMIILLIILLISWNLIDGFTIGSQENNYDAEVELDILSLSCYWRIGSNNNLEYVNQIGANCPYQLWMKSKYYSGHCMNKNDEDCKSNNKCLFTNDNVCIPKNYKSKYGVYSDKTSIMNVITDIDDLKEVVKDHSGLDDINDNNDITSLKYPEIDFEQLSKDISNRNIDEVYGGGDKFVYGDEEEDDEEDVDEEVDEVDEKEYMKPDDSITMDVRDIYVDMCPRDYNIKQIKLREKMSRSNQIPGYTSRITFDAMRRIPDPDKPFPVDPDFFKN